MDDAGVSRALVFALNEPTARPPTARPTTACWTGPPRASGRLVPFVRLPPRRGAARRGAPLPRARRARHQAAPPRAALHGRRPAARGGLRARRRARACRCSSTPAAACPPGMAAELARVADRHPEASLILAHAAIVEQGLIAEIASGQPNVYFDTSTWTPLDLLALLGRVAPEQILCASDIPYGQQPRPRDADAAARCARRPRRRDPCAAIMGETRDGLLRGQPAGAHLAAAGRRRPCGRRSTGARAHTYLGCGDPHALAAASATSSACSGSRAGACRDGNGPLERRRRAHRTRAGVVWRASLDGRGMPLELQRRRRAALRLLQPARQAGGAVRIDATSTLVVNGERCEPSSCPTARALAEVAARRPGPDRAPRWPAPRARAAPAPCSLDGGPVALVHHARRAGRRRRGHDGRGATRRASGLQRAFIDEDAFQCGFCTPGQLHVGDRAAGGRRRAHARAGARTAMSGNLCRCGAYAGIERAVLRAAAEGAA